MLAFHFHTPLYFLPLYFLGLLTANGNTMKAATTQGFGPGSRLVIKDVDKPRPGPGDVLVEVYASSVNPKDWKLNTNLSSLLPKVGPLAGLHIIGDDLAGVVAETGASVSGFQVGDAVYGMDMRLRTAACAEYAVIDQQRIAHKPANIAFAEAAAVPLAALTALQAFQLAKVEKGHRVLVIGASGGVGTFAVQIARAMGAEVTAVCSGRNSELVTNLGAEQVIDYTREDYIGSSDNFDMVFDVTAYESLDSCSSLLKEDGIFISTIGHPRAILGLFKARFSRGRQTAKRIAVESYTHDLETLKGYIEAGRVKPIVDSQYSLENIHDAFARSKTGRCRGKVVINIRD
jgi:2-desacetyl-2-hydroxyethyl bacteriochlorophyllide A dehydrogenase